ncbi:hypothetical protein PoB_004452900 [Plakobranchus ocellatus]|uniref:Uncharacterized protein n=1 Tax=Plakobranchus ocellatus TaxID=259542 RepID=A0AAV4BGP0_9GAST|nr:hypothetical protein PoB_004452900 [Plakobranchus ocellatus]
MHAQMFNAGRYIGEEDEVKAVRTTIEAKASQSKRATPNIQAVRTNIEAKASYSKRATPNIQAVRTILKLKQKGHT